MIARSTVAGSHKPMTRQIHHQPAGSYATKATRTRQSKSCCFCGLGSPWVLHVQTRHSSLPQILGSNVKHPHPASRCSNAVTRFRRTAVHPASTTAIGILGENGSRWTTSRNLFRPTVSSLDNFQTWNLSAGVLVETAVLTPPRANDAGLENKSSLRLAN